MLLQLGTIFCIFIVNIGLVHACEGDGWHYSEITNHCYKVFTKGSSYQEAETTCLSEKSHLTSIHSENENFIISDLIGYEFEFEEFPTYTWIGLARNPNNKQEFIWVDGTPLDYKNWAPNQPSNGGGIEDGVMMYTNMYAHDSNYNFYHQWNDSPMGYKRIFVCKKGKPGSEEIEESPCEVDWVHFAATNSCYKAFAGRSNFWNGESTCVEENSHLTSIHSLPENNFVAGMVTTGKLVEFPVYTWIGLQRNPNNTEEFIWLDGSTFDYNYWAQNQPNNGGGLENAVMIYSDIDKNDIDNGFFLKWNDSPAEFKRAFVCKKDAFVGKRQVPLCEAGWTYFAYTDSCYKVPAGIFQYHHGVLACMDESSNLTSIHSLIENDFVADLAVTKSTYATTRYTWIGLYKDIYGQYLWVDETPLDYFHWAIGQPSNPREDTIMIWTQTAQTESNKGFFNKWNDSDFWFERTIVCKKSANRSLFPNPSEQTII